VVSLMEMSTAFARKRRINIRSAPAPKHQSVTKTDPGGVARHPDDVELDRKVGSESVNGRS
jgi:hypothetical protein